MTNFRGVIPFFACTRLFWSFIHGFAGSRSPPASARRVGDARVRALRATTSWSVGGWCWSPRSTCRCCSVCCCTSSSVPNMAEIRANFGASMKDPVARFWAVEHITTMLAGGRPRARRARARAEGGDAGLQAHEAVHLFRHRDGADAAGDSVARDARGPAVVPVLTTFSGRETSSAGCHRLS